MVRGEVNVFSVNLATSRNRPFREAVMGKFIDITGQRFGYLTAISPAGTRASGNKLWLCQCDCGRQIISSGSDLRARTKSCGCKPLKHGHSKQANYHPLYAIWKTIRQRCNNPANADYRWYGARGITICKRWDDFTVFLSDIGERPSPELTIDRINNEGNYEPGNIRWATWAQQRNNKRPRAKPIPRSPSSSAERS